MFKARLGYFRGIGKNMANFKVWLKTFISEKDIDVDQIIEVEGESGINIIEFNCLLDAILQAPKHEQAQIKNTLVKIDFMNGDVMHFFKHLAKAIAI